MDTTPNGQNGSSSFNSDSKSPEHILTLANRLREGGISANGGALTDGNGRQMITVLSDGVLYGLSLVVVGQILDDRQKNLH